VTDHAGPPEPPDLTPRQWDVVRCVGGEFMSYKAAARELGLSARTIEHYAVRIRDRVDLDGNPKDVLIRIAILFPEEDEEAA